MTNNQKQTISPTPKVTLDDLALMVKNGFDHMDKKFDKVDVRFDKVDERLDKVEDRLDKVEQSVYVLDSHMKTLEVRVGKLEYVLYEEMRPTMETIQLLWRGHERRIGALERKTGLARR